MDISDFSNRREEDEDIRLFREDYPDVYDFVLKVLDGTCDKPTLQAFKDEYGKEFLYGILKIILGKASSKDIEAFREEYSEEIYNAIIKMMQKGNAAIEGIPESVPKREKFRKGDFIGQKYEVFGVLGEGACGIVYLVYSHETKSAYALKTFRDEYLEDVTTRERFKKEAQVWIDIERHPYLVRASFVDEISGRLYIAMEHIAPDDEGLNTLEGYLRRRPPDMAQTLRWAIQFCHGMEHAYSKGIKAHRDIKPANIMISTDKTVKISDFGLAGFIGISKAFSGIKINPQRNISGEAYQTMAGSAFGTPPYMPPEQFENAAGCDERSDIYSFGIVLYQMASGGKLPFYPDVSGSGEDDVFQKWYMLHRQSPVPKLSTPLFPVIFRCLEKEPINRYFSFKELRRDFETLLKKQTGEVVKVPELKELEAWAWGNKGVSLDNLGKSAEAIACYGRVLEINPRDAKAWNNKGVALGGLGKYQEAIACYDRALEINPSYAKAWNNKGNALGRLSKHQEAIACYDKALEINPRDAAAWSNKGAALGSLGKYQDEIACYDKALEINPGDAVAWYNKGNALGRLSKHQEAIACYDRSLEINPGDAETWYNKGNTLVRLSKHQEAMACYDKTLELNPGFAKAWYIKGLVLEMLDKHQEAINAFNCFIKFAPPQDAKRVSKAKETIQKIEVSLAKDKVDDLRQNHSEPLANSGFKIEDREPRLHHYLFSHVILPKLLFENPQQLVEKLLTHWKTFLITLWDTCANEISGIKEKIPSSGLDCKIIKVKDNISIILISLPKPLKSTEAYFTAIVYRPKKLFLIKQKGIARYITLERTIGNGDKTAVLCEWEINDKNIKHINHGKRFGVTEENFIGAIKDLIFGE